MGNNKNKRLTIAQRRDSVARKAEERVRQQEEEAERYVHFLFSHILTAFKYPISFGISLSLSCKQVSSSSYVNS